MQNQAPRQARSRTERTLQLGTLGLVLAGSMLLRADLTNAQDEPAVGFIAAVQGQVDIQHRNESIWLPAAIDEEVLVGDTLRTDLDAAVKVVLIDDTVLGLGEDTELTVDNFVIGPEALRQVSVLRQVRGQLRTRVGEAFGGTTRIEVHTPTAIMGVKGTEGTTRIDPLPATANDPEPSSTLVRNWEGGITAAVAGGSPMAVPPGRCRVVYADRVGLPTECPDDFMPVTFEPPVGFAPAKPESELVLVDRTPAVSAAIQGGGVREAVGAALLVEPPDPVIEDRADAETITGGDINPLANLDFGSGETGSNPNPIGGIDFGSGEAGSDPNSIGNLDFGSGEVGSNVTGGP